MTAEYQPAVLEKQAQQWWEQHKLFQAELPEGGDSAPTFYCLSMFPYPSGALHMGHVRNYAMGDAMTRFQMMQGKRVLQPMGWDAFGLPAENAALKQKTHPWRWTQRNIGNMRAQLQAMGLAYDWRRELQTCDPDYYRWEQWMFVRLMKRGLAYRKEAEVNWDPVDQTVLANEQVEDGRGWRSGAVVERRRIPQWFVRITDYCEELLQGLRELEGQWPKAVIAAQVNWIGRSEGAAIRFALDDADKLPAEMRQIEVFTTRSDTLMGAVALAIAPNHPLVAHCDKTPQIAELVAEHSRTRVSGSDEALLEKKGALSGLAAMHPLSGESIPVWVANFVLMEYGSGAVMMVPGHDQRDWEFADAYGLEKPQVIAVDDSTDIARQAETRLGTLVNSGEFDGLTSEEAKRAVTDALAGKGLAESRTTYRLRDWCVSRQRYWGVPIPVIHCEKCGPVPVPEEDLPVELPLDIEYSGPGSPLHQLEEWLKVPCPQCGGEGRRETDTFDTFVDSSWYFARFASLAGRDSAMIDADARQWLPVDQYIGGVEHAVLHLLYARFFYRMMRDEGLVPGDEPFKRLLTQGMVIYKGSKMSKSRGNTVGPQEMIEQYGVDTLRLFMLFTAPPEQAIDWAEQGVQGSWRFVNRFWRKVQAFAEQGLPTEALAAKDLDKSEQELRRKAHQTLSRAETAYAERLSFNTIIAAVMELLNALPDEWLLASSSANRRALASEVLRLSVQIMAPITPHLSHHLWRALGQKDDPLVVGWPQPDPQALSAETQKIVVQVNGKVRGQIEVPADADQDALAEAAVACESVQSHLGDRSPDRVIVVPGRLVNLVLSP